MEAQGSGLHPFDGGPANPDGDDVAFTGCWVRGIKGSSHAARATPKVAKEIGKRICVTRTLPILPGRRAAVRRRSARSASAADLLYQQRGHWRRRIDLD